MEETQYEQRHREAKEIVDSAISIYTGGVIKGGINNFLHLFNHDWNECHSKIAKKLVDGANKFGGVAIKACQFMGLRKDIPEPYQKVFSSCFEDNSTRSNFNHVKKTLTPIWKELTDVSPNADFSASVAQVHYCVYSGQPSVVKIIHPGVRETYDIDLKIMASLGAYVDGYKDARGAAVMLSAVAGKLSQLKDSELDLRLEAKNQEKMYNYFSSLGNNSPVRIPKVYASDMNYLLMERLNGKTASYFLRRMSEGGQGFSNELTPTQRKLVYKAYAEMIFNLKFVQTDPNPGNIFVQDNHKIALLDFGQCMEINEKTLQTLKEFIQLAPDSYEGLENKEQVKKWLSILGIIVKEKEAINTAKLLFFSEGEGTFPFSDELDSDLIPFVLNILYLSRLENNCSQLRITNLMKDSRDPFVLLNCWKEYCKV